MNAREKQSETAPFKAGDLVRVTEVVPNYFFRKGDVGTVLDINPHSIKVNFNETWPFHPNPAIRSNGIWFVGPKEGFSACELVKAFDVQSMEKEIVRLTGEVSTLKAEWALMNEELASANATADAEHSALLEARAQLEDIAAIERVNRLVSAIHGTDLKQDWTFHGLIIAVTEGKVAA